MNRAEFMNSLAELLKDMSPAEREEAIQYYNDYFDDAGEENEQSVIASLGSPEQLAKSIKAGLASGGNSGEFTEKGFFGYEQSKSNEIMNPNQAAGENEQRNNQQFTQENAYGYKRGSQNYGGYQNNNGYQNYNGYQNQYSTQVSPEKKQEKKRMSGGMIALIVVLCILASPLLLGIAGSIFGIIVGIFGTLFGLVVGFGVAAVVLLIVGVCLFVHGIGIMFGAPLAGLCTMGAAMICAAIGLFFLWLVVMLCGALIPAVIRGITKLFQNIFHKGGAAA